MSVLFVILSVVFLLGCAGVCGAILLQKKKSAGGMGSIAGMGASDTYYNKNKGRSEEGTLETWTKLGGTLLAVLAIALAIIS